VSSRLTPPALVPALLTVPGRLLPAGPANRDVALGARKGLFIVDLQNPYDPPRFLPHNSSWEVADVQVSPRPLSFSAPCAYAFIMQWNPFPHRSEWVVSTVSSQPSLGARHLS
jgi:hypothetical protein